MRGFSLECLSSPKGDKTLTRRIAHEMAVHLLRHPTEKHDDLVAAYDEAAASTPVTVPVAVLETSVADPIDAVAQMVASTEPCTCILIGKTYTLVLAPSGGAGQFIVLNVDTKRVEFTHAPGYDVAIDAANVCESTLFQECPPVATTVVDEEPAPVAPVAKKVKRAKQVVVATTTVASE